MKTSRIIVAAIIVFGSVLCLATEEEGEILLADLTGMQLCLDGAPYYYRVAPENGRVLLKRPCVPVEDEDDYDVLVVWDEDGHEIFERAPHFDIPGMVGNKVYASTLLTPDRLVISTVVRREGWSWELGQYDIAKDELLSVIPTSPIRCRDLRGDERGTIWCLGDNQSKRTNNQDFNLVYRFDHAGRLLGSTLPRSAFLETPHPLSELKTQTGFGGFLPGEGELRLWLPDIGELISFDSEGEVAVRMTLPTVEGQVKAWLVTAPEKEIFAMLVSGTDVGNPRTYTQALYRLAPDGGSWIPLHDPPIQLPMRIRLAGADDEGLILLDRESLELLWYPLEGSLEGEAGSN